MAAASSLLLLASLLVTSCGAGLAIITVDGDVINQFASNAANVHYDTSATRDKAPNIRPIIGILAQEYHDPVPGYPENLTYIPASYVKNVESAGARVVPIFIDQPDEYYTKMFDSLNGFVFPGGRASITNSSGYGRAGDTLYQMILEANAAGTITPLFATCLGFEMLNYLASGYQLERPLTRCQAFDVASSLKMNIGWSQSQLFGGASAGLMEAVQTKNITANFHKYCVLPKTFHELGISDDYRMLSTSFDADGLEYVSTMEHKRYPIFGTHWHPEKAVYEWLADSSIPHSVDAVDLAHHTTRVFMEAARQNHKQFSSEEEAESYLIYNYAPIYAEHVNNSTFQQLYVFPA